jgi:hypothetical protein
MHRATGSWVNPKGFTTLWAPGDGRKVQPALVSGLVGQPRMPHASQLEVWAISASIVEAGKRPGMSVENARRIARALHITLDQLVGDSELEPAVAVGC